MLTYVPIDVVVPAYNAARYLPECLASLAAQTARPRGVIVVDDGSTDDTAAVAHAFGATVLSQPNRGCAEARNAGIRAATAPYIAFLDADDRSDPQRFEHQWRLHEARPAIAIIASDYAKFDAASNSGPTLAASAAFAALRRERVSSAGFVVAASDLLSALAVRNFLPPSTMLVARRLFTEHGAYFTSREKLGDSSSCSIGEDYEWLLRVLRYTDVAFVDRVLCDYRIVANSLSANIGRIRYGDVALARMIARSPDAYVSGAAEALGAHVPLALRESAISHIRSGEIDLAASRIGELAEVERRPARFAYALGAALLRPRFVRRLAGPLLRRLRRPRFAK